MSDKERKKLRDYTLDEFTEMMKNCNFKDCEFRKVHIFFCAICAVCENLPKEILDKEV